MTTAQLVIVCLTVLTLALLAGAVILLSRHERASEHTAPASSELAEMASTVVVHTVDGRSLRGYVVRAPGPVIVLDDAAYLENGEAHALGGIQTVPRTNVAWIQELAAPPQPRYEDA